MPRPAKNEAPTDPALLLVNISQLLTLRSPSGNSGPRRGPELQELGIIKDGAVLSVGRKIVSACKTRDALRDPWIKKNRKKIVEIDCAGQVVLPGFVDSHTHPAFVTPRLVDFEQRIAGATYEQIAEAGGGIRSSLEGVRKAGRKLLTDKVLSALHEMAEQGTTTVEAKSGYGLTLDSEIKSLEAIRGAAAKWPGTVVATLLGAHVVPREFHGRAHEYVEWFVKKWSHWWRRESWRSLWTYSPTAAPSRRKTRKESSMRPRNTAWECGPTSAS